MAIQSRVLRSHRKVPKETACSYVEPTDDDVVVGLDKHPGTINFQKLVDEYIPELRSKKVNDIAERLFDSTIEDGGRFVEPVDNEGLLVSKTDCKYALMDDHKALRMICQKLQSLRRSREHEPPSSFVRLEANSSAQSDQAPRVKRKSKRASSKKSSHPTLTPKDVLLGKFIVDELRQVYTRWFPNNCFGTTEGRGGRALRHAGNANFRRLVDLNRALYRIAPRLQKHKISEMIVQKIYKQGGRFVKEINGADTYNETEAVSHKQALEKTSQALREKKIPAAQAARILKVNASRDKKAATKHMTKASIEMKQKPTGNPPSKKRKARVETNTNNSPAKRIQEMDQSSEDVTPNAHSSKQVSESHMDVEVPMGSPDLDIPEAQLCCTALNQTSMPPTRSSIVTPTSFFQVGTAEDEVSVDVSCIQCSAGCEDESSRLWCNDCRVQPLGLDVFMPIAISPITLRDQQRTPRRVSDIASPQAIRCSHDDSPAARRVCLFNW